MVGRSCWDASRTLMKRARNADHALVPRPLSDATRFLMDWSNMCHRQRSRSTSYGRADTAASNALSSSANNVRGRRLLKVSEKSENKEVKFATVSSKSRKSSTGRDLPSASTTRIDDSL
jgi:hypothetical protein